MSRTPPWAAPAPEPAEPLGVPGPVGPAQPSGPQPRTAQTTPDRPPRRGLPPRVVPYLYLIASAVQGMAAVLVQPFSIHLFGGVRSPGWNSASFAISVMQVGLVAFSAGFPLAITRAWLEPGDGPRNARAINGFNVLLAVLGGALGLGIAALAGAPAYLLASIWSMAALAVVVAAQAQLRAQARPLTFAALAAGSSLIAHLFGLTAIALFGAHAAVFMGGFAVSTTLTALAGILLTRPTAPQKAWGAVKTAVVAGAPLLPHSFAIILLMQGDSILLKRLASPGETGVYLAALVFAQGPIAVLAGLNNAWSATVLKASHGDPAEFERISRSTLRTATRLGALMAVLGSIGAPLGILVLAQGNPDTTRVAVVLPVLGIGYALYLVSTNILFGRLRTTAFYWVTPAVVVLAAAAAAWPASRDALVGVAWAKVAAFTLLGLAYAWNARKDVALPMLRTVVLVAAAGLVAAAVLAVYTLLLA
ncbi:lipopolysaccharide biosynthesis protein [Rothia kristinae]|uniref:Polysaccharide biosynthesis protein n=1 Tax=Rothia kristinae TaxID=37923 RepID=A0A1S2N217_9MICC|nr:hypothetical protein [Rothia kristinae]OIJ36752.1 hypothetical protein BK826_02495 [Rothia kristinae]